MRKGQLIRKVLTAYKAHIEFIKENYGENDFVSVLEYIDSHDLTYGICFYICYALGQNQSGYDAEWVKKYYRWEYGHAWGNYPSNCNSIDKILESLQIRVDNLEKELASGDKLHQRLTSRNYLFR